MKINLYILPVLLVILFSGCAYFRSTEYTVPPPEANTFTSAEYTDNGIPSFQEAKKFLPVPVLEKDKELLDMYWYCWGLTFKHIKKPFPASGFPSNFLDEAFNRDIFQWDTIFMLMFARYGHQAFPFINSLDNFYTKQHPDGYICRELLEKNGRDFFKTSADPKAVNPPLFAWAELESFKLTGDVERLRKVLPVLERYAAWLEIGRRKKNTVHKLFWNSNLGSGMDNSPRSGSGWVDMSAQMVIQYNCMAYMADVLGEKDKASYFRNRADEIAALMNKWMWNSEDGLYYDVDDKGKQIKRKTIACFWPMLAGVTTEAQTEALLKNLKNPKTFWRTIVFPTLSADDKVYKPRGGYWHGAVWAPTNMAVIKGLERQGRYDFAYEASEKYLKGMEKVFRKTGTVWENYAPDSYSQGKPAKPRFVGWTGCGPIALLIENIIGIKCDAAAKRIIWRIHRTDSHGVKNLRFGNTKVSLTAEARENNNLPLSITVESSGEFTLTVYVGGKRKEFTVHKGKNTLKL